MVDSDGEESVPVRDSTAPDENAQLRQALETITVESWRLTKVMARFIEQADAGESRRYRSKLDWFTRQLADSLQSVGMHLVDLEGQPYEPGHAASPINLDEFQPEDQLIVDQMLEPILMGPDGPLRTGKFIVRKAGK